MTVRTQVYDVDRADAESFLIYCATSGSIHGQYEL